MNKQVLIIGNNHVVDTVKELSVDGIQFLVQDDPFDLDSHFEINPCQAVIICLDSAADENCFKLVKTISDAAAFSFCFVVSVKQRDETVARIFTEGADQYFRIEHTQTLLQFLEAWRDHQNDSESDGGISIYARKAAGNDTQLVGLLNALVDAVIIINDSGVIERINQATLKMFGHSESELIGQSINLLMPDNYSRKHNQFLYNFNRTGEANILGRKRQLVARKKDGSEFPIELAVDEMSLDGQKKFVGLIQDITKQRTVENTLEKTESRLDFLVNANPVVIYTLQIQDDKFTLAYVSKNVEQVFGYSRTFCLNEPDFWENRLEPGSKDKILADVQRILETNNYRHHYRFRMCNGEYRWIQDESRLYRDENGNPVEVVGYWLDIDKLKKYEQLIIENEERLRRSQFYANIGTWDWNIQTGELFWSERIAPLFGYEDGCLETTYENFLAAVHEEDRRKVIDAVNNCVKNNTEYNIEHRCVWPDGKVRWMLERGDVARDEEGNPLRMLGVVQDITSRKLLEHHLAQQKELLNLIQNGLSQFVINTSIREVADYLLRGVTAFTESEFGFIGEVMQDQSGESYLKIHALSNIIWDEATQKFYDENAPEGLEFRNRDTLFGKVIDSGHFVLKNNISADDPDIHLPEGHPCIKSFLGVPVYYGNTLVGMYGLANRKGGFDETIVKLLEPFNAGYGVIIETKHMQKREAESREELVHAKDEAEKANLAKSEFLSSMSHELRTPMNAILGFAQLLGFEEELNESQIDLVQEIQKAGGHLLELINDVLDLAKIESGRLNLTIRQVSLKSIIDDCYSLMLPLAESGNICMQTDFAMCDTRVSADEVRLKQVLLNLISNAIKYNKPHGQIRIGCRRNQNNVVVDVIDTGYGISDDKIQQMFKPFNRLGKENSEVEGTGIGLFICKRLTSLMGGSITFTSKQDEGSTFSIHLLESGGLEHLNDIEGTDDDAQAAPDFIDGEKILLYVEDNPANLKLIEQICQRVPGLRIISAHNGDLGLDMARLFLPDLVLLDINLPGLNGFQVLKRLRDVDETRSIPIIALSANAQKTDVEKGLDAGFNEYLTKPIDVQTFLNTLTHYLGISDEH